MGKAAGCRLWNHISHPFCPSVVCHLEGSGQWPQDAEAVQRVRAAFQLRLAEVLTQEHRLQCRATATHTDVLKVRLLQGRNHHRAGSRDLRAYRKIAVGRGLGDQGSRQQCTPQVLALDIPCLCHLFPQDGFVFRIQVAYQREPQILKEVRSPEGMVSLRDTPASLRLERDTKLLPLLTSALHG